MSVIPAGGREVVGDSPDRRVEILCDAEEVNATWSRFGPGREGADLHVHRRHTDIFYVLEGELTVRLGLEDRQVAVPAGTFAVVPSLTVHGFRNASDADVRYLNFHAPGEGFADYMRALRDGRRLTYDQYDPPPDGGRPASAALAGVSAVDVAAIRITEVSGRPPQAGAYVYVLEGEQAGAWAFPGADLAGPVRFLEIRAG
jgi:mannose-6-phosphate isomerase-like protein (cupin superfamily)